MSDWKTIDTKPPHETDVLVWSKEGYSVARWDNDRREWFATCEGSWVYEGGATNFFRHPEPAHWMPLPEPPDA